MLKSLSGLGSRCASLIGHTLDTMHVKYRLKGGGLYVISYREIEVYLHSRMVQDDAGKITLIRAHLAISRLHPLKPSQSSWHSK
jgi:hypothetical protein